MALLRKTKEQRETLPCGTCIELRMSEDIKRSINCFSADGAYSVCYVIVLLVLSLQIRKYDSERHCNANAVSPDWRPTEGVHDIRRLQNSRCGIWAELPMGDTCGWEQHVTSYSDNRVIFVTPEVYDLPNGVVDEVHDVLSMNATTS